MHNYTLFIYRLTCGYPFFFNFSNSIWTLSLRWKILIFQCYVFNLEVACSPCGSLVFSVQKCQWCDFSTQAFFFKGDALFLLLRNFWWFGQIWVSHFLILIQLSIVTLLVLFFIPLPLNLILYKLFIWLFIHGYLIVLTWYTMWYIEDHFPFWWPS